MNKLIFLIDGFNVYHSILTLQRQTRYCTKWLDLAALCKSYVHHFGKDAKIESIYYFSALPHYLSSRKPDKIKRHQRYISCLESTNVIVELGRFKEKDVYCNKCRSMILKHEEKETDVAIAVNLLKIFFEDSCDTAVIISGDTDLSPAIRECKELFPNKKIIFIFPYARKNKELAMLAPRSFTISKKQYIRYQFPNPVILANGQQIHKPPSW